jgi:hypothetical protein
MHSRWCRSCLRSLACFWAMDLLEMAITSAAFIAAHPDWLITTEYKGHCIKISNIRPHWSTGLQVR